MIKPVLQDDAFLEDVVRAKNDPRPSASLVAGTKWIFDPMAGTSPFDRSLSFGFAHQKICRHE